MAEAKLVYMDASAFVKLVIPEPETDALIATLTPQTRMVASTILEIETVRAACRASGKQGADTARAQLAGIRLLPLTARIRGRACDLEPETLRSLDAIHLATALDLGDRLDCIYVYDTRMTSAAQAAGLHACAPSTKPPAENTETDTTSRSTSS